VQADSRWPSAAPCQLAKVAADVRQCKRKPTDGLERPAGQETAAATAEQFAFALLGFISLERNKWPSITPARLPLADKKPAEQKN
jgi:hypothetical protein